MLNSISLEKFKAFADLQNMEIKPLTVLCGVNSGGKSSILKSLLLLKQSYENSSASNEMTLNGQYTNCGLMKDVLFKGKGSEFTLINTFVVKYSGKKYVKNSKQDISTARELGRITKLSPQDVSYFQIDVTCTVCKKEVAELWDTNYIKYYKIGITPYDSSAKTSTNKSFYLELSYRPGKRGKYDVVLDNFPTISLDRITHRLENCICYFSGMRLTNLYYEVNNKNEREVELSNFLNNIYSISRIVADQYNGIKYLGPLRENPKRQYSISNETIQNDSTGADTPFVLAKNKQKSVISDLFPPLCEDDLSSRKCLPDSNFYELIQCWMKYFDLGSISLQSVEDTQTLLLNVKDSNIADVGFGISQTLPIIVHGLSMDYEQTLLLEQPEIHLHPRMQMRMADFLITLAQTNHGVIVETHSDHIINRLIRRILEDETDSLLNSIRIYFVENNDDGSSIQNIKIDKVRGIYESPQEFFSQFSSETSYIVKAGIKNMKGIK